MHKPVKQYSASSGDSWILTIVIVLAFGFLCIGALFVVGSSFSFGMTFTGETSQKNVTDKISEDVRSIEIVNQYGDISVKHQEEFGWTWDLTVWADTQEKADELKEQVRMEVTQHDTAKQTWELKLPDDMSEFNGVKSDLVLHVPKSVATVINNRHGETWISEVDGSVRIDSEHGDISCLTCPGAVEIKTRHGDVVLKEIGGLTINNRHGDLSIAHSSDAIKISSEHSDLRAVEVNGALLVDNAHGDIDASGIQGDVEIKNRHGDIEIDCYSENVNCTNRHADTKVRVHNPLVQNVVLRGKHLDIDLSLPDSVSPKLITDVKHGDVHSDLASQSSGTAIIDLATSHGDIRIRQHAVAKAESSARNMPESQEQAEAESHTAPVAGN